MKKPIGKRLDVIKGLLSGEINISKATNLLSCSRRSIERYKKAFVQKGEAGLKDHRHSNYRKLSEKQKEDIIALKQKDRWRSARNIRDELKLSLSEHQVQRILVAKGLGRENLKRVKAIIRFEATAPNDLWQTDIMGKIDFPNISILYLIATLDDHSRFVPAGRWFKTQGKMNVFQIWYESLSKCGLPDKMLQDEGSQYKARARFGTADYEWYAKQAGIKLIWANRAETKGKIERFWKFVQGDFVPSVINAKTIEEVNGAFKIWLANTMGLDNFRTVFL
ncbi:MAG: helix-turn-helix domain-containing protein [Patescibacteria group bacterium]